MGVVGRVGAMARRPHKQRWADKAHGASAEGGWARPSVSVLWRAGRPPAQAARGRPASHRANATGRMGVVSSSRVLPGGAEFSTTG